MLNKEIRKREDWEPIRPAFLKWLNNRESLLRPALSPKPSVKVLIFLALLDSPREFNTYDDIYECIIQNNVIAGEIPKITLRTSLIALEKALEKANHPLMVHAVNRGCFKLEKRTKKEQKNKSQTKHTKNSVVLITEGLINPEEELKEIAYSIIKKTIVPYKALYMLEWSARMWAYYSYSTLETSNRFQHEWKAWDTLNIKKRLSQNGAIKNCLSVVGLAVGEGLSEIGLLQTIFTDKDISKIHYLAVDASPRLLRDHIALIKETFSKEIYEGRLLCAGILADMMNNLKEAVDTVKNTFLSEGISDDFLPRNSGLLITYFGNSLGNNPDQEIETFSIIKSAFKNRPLEFLLGISVVGQKPDQYERDFDNFLLKMPRHLLETSKIFESSMTPSEEFPEFVLSESELKHQERYPEIKPELYAAAHGIRGEIYRFYYRLEFDLKMSASFDKDFSCLKKGTLIHLISIIKYDMQNFINAICTGVQFKVVYDKKLNTYFKERTKEREYAIISAYLEE